MEEEKDQRTETMEETAEETKETASHPADISVEETEAVPDNTPKEVLIVGVRFRSGAKTYYFDPGEETFRPKDCVIVETARGTEFGTVTIGNRTISAALAVLPLKKVLRRATEQDKKRNADNCAAEERAKKICAEKIEKHKLEMKLVDAEYTFDNSKLLFYFTADGRVDFRDLVKDLASAFRTRIELRQIGIRDEARAMGGLGICGRPFCCSSFLPDFVQVSIKMAKEQNFSLNSAKISGSCGRLMCCLRYEHEVYEEALKTTPPVGSLVATPNGNGVVIETKPLAQAVKVRLEEGNEAPKMYDCSAISVLSTGKGKRPKPPVKTAEETEKKEEKSKAPEKKPPEDGGRRRKKGNKDKDKMGQKPESND